MDLKEVKKNKGSFLYGELYQFYVLPRYKSKFKSKFKSKSKFKFKSKSKSKFKFKSKSKSKSYWL